MVAILLLSTALGGGLLFLASFGSAASGIGNGDWTITDDVTISQHISYGNITITGDGSLTVINGQLLMASNHLEGRDLSITVSHGGTLRLNNATLGAILTKTEGSSPVLSILVEDGGRLIMENGSVLKFPGHIVVDNGELIVKDSTIRGMAGSDPEDNTGDIAYYCDPDVFPADNFSHSPIINIISSYFLLQNSSILDMHEGGTLDPAVWTAGYSFVQDDDQRDAASYSVSRYPSAFNGVVDATDLRAADGQRHEILEGGVLNVTGFDMGGLLFSAGEATVSLHVLYRSGDAFSGTADLEVGRETVYTDVGNLVNTLGPLGNSDALLSVALPDMASWEYADLGVRIQNTLGSNDAIEIDRMWLSVQMDVPVFGNLTLMGDSRLMLIDSYINVDHSNEDPLTHNALVLRDQAQAELYGFSCDVGVGQPFANSIVLVPKTIDLLPLNATTNDTTSNSISDLFYNDSSPYSISNGQIMAVTFNSTGITGSILSADLVIISTWGPSANPTNPVVKYNLNGQIYNTPLQPVNTLYSSSYRIPIVNFNEIETLEVSYSSIMDSVDIEQLQLRVTTNPQANIYKWADVQVRNDYQALGGILVQPFTQVGSQAASYMDGGQWSDVPPQEVLDYLGRGSAYNITDANGSLVMPLLVDVLKGTSKQLVGSYSYNLVATAQSASGPVTGQTALQFKSYPYLSALSNDDLLKPVIIILSDALPDLEVLTIELRDWTGSILAPVSPGDPIPVQRTESVNITINITNRGPVPATGFMVQLFDGSTLLRNFTVSHIDPWNGTDPVVTLYYDWVAQYPLDVHDLRVVIDPEGVVVEVDEDNNDDIVQVEVLAAPELMVGLPQLIVNSTGSHLVTNITNVGDIATGSFDIEFHINGAFNTTIPVLDLGAGNSTSVSLPYVQGSAGPLVVEVVSSNSSNHLLNGINSSNNLGIDLSVANLNTQSSTYVVGSNVQASFTIQNDGVYNASDVNVTMQLFQNGVAFGAPVYRQLSLVPAGESVLMQETWSGITPTMGVQWVTFELQVTVNPGAVIPETSFVGNQASHTFFVNDNRPDLALSYLATSVGAAGPLGMPIEIHFQVDNLGSSTAATPMLTIYLDNGTAVQIINVTLSPIAAGANLNTTVSWSIRGDVGNQHITAIINEFGTTADRNTSNNQMSTPFEVTALVPELRLNSNMLNYKVGDLMVVWGTLLNANNNTERLASSTVVLTIRDGENRLINTYTLTTDQTGYFRQEIPVTELMAGSTTITATATYGSETTVMTLDRVISSGITDGGQAWWMWIIIILVMLLIIIIFSFYIYRYSIGKMVECGECHSLIPEASHRCPNCGVDFEVGTAKCSECGGWIPANSKKCPECGASFIGTIVSDEEESDYIQLMREGYGLYVDTFRVQAQEELGKKYNDQRFLRWWTDHPEHITFEEWLAKEEASRKEQTFKCPSCGTVNAKGAKQCIRCNRSFVRANTSILEDEEKPAATIRRVVRKRKIAEEAPKKEAVEEKAPEQPTLKKRTVLRKEDVESKKEPEEEKEE